MQRQGWTKAVVWLLCGSATLASCSKKKPSEPAAAPSPSAASSSVASATPQTSAAPEKEPEPPKAALSFRLGHRFPIAVTMFPLVKGVLACSDCDIGDKPNNDRHVFFFDGKTAKELPNLLSDKRISANLDESVTQLLKPFNGGKYTFSGTGPNQLELEVYGWLDDGSNGRQGYPHENRYLTYDGKGWLYGQSGYEKNPELYEYRRSNTYRGSLPRKYDHARLHAGNGLAVASNDGPLLEIANAVTYGDAPTKAYVGFWNGNSWQRRDAPWESTFVVLPVSSGRTLVLANNGAYAIDNQGVPSPIAFEDEHTPGNEFKMLMVGKEPWLLTSRSIYLPSEPGLRPSAVLARERETPRPAAPTVADSASPATSTTPVVSASAAPSASVGAPSPAPVVSASAAPSANVGAPSPAPVVSASAAPSANVGALSPAPVVSASSGVEPNVVPAMTNFSERCKTPFVVLFTPPQAQWN